MADALLCVRGHLSTRRTTGIAGIACGLPVIGYEGGETGYPMTEAGAVLVPDGDREALARALARVLVEEDLWRTLHQRNLSAHERFFSWDAIARCYMRVLSRA
jgi:glycosyltransferase involved in cell wall biosynthesis